MRLTPPLLRITMFYAGNMAVFGEHVEHLGFLYRSWEVKDYSIPATANDVFILTLLHSKGGIHQIDQQKHYIEGYQVHLTFPGQSSSFFFREKTLAYQVKISKQNFENICLSFHVNIKLLRDYPILEIYQHEFEILSNELSQIGSELCRFRPRLTMVGFRIAISLQEISRFLMNRIGHIAQYSQPIILDRFLELIELHYKQEHHVAYYANLLNVTANSLWKQTHQYTETTPIKLIHDRLLKEAMRLLSSSPNPIKATMIELGFADSATFSHFFKKKTNMSPSEYQKQFFTAKI